MTTTQWLTILIALIGNGVLVGVMYGKQFGMVREHDREILKLRDAKHDHANVLTGHGLRIGNLEEDVADIKRKTGA